MAFGDNGATLTGGSLFGQAARFFGVQPIGRSRRFRRAPSLAHVMKSPEIPKNTINTNIKQYRPKLCDNGGYGTLSSWQGVTNIHRRRRCDTGVWD